MILDVYQMRY